LKAIRLISPLRLAGSTVAASVAAAAVVSAAVVAAVVSGAAVVSAAVVVLQPAKENVAIIVIATAITKNHKNTFFNIMHLFINQLLFQPLTYFYPL